MGHFGHHFQRNQWRCFKKFPINSEFLKKNRDNLSGAGEQFQRLHKDLSNIIERQINRGKQGTREVANSFSPTLLSLTRHGRRGRIFDLHPMR